VQLALKRPAATLRDFSRAIALSSRYGQAYVNRGQALVTLHRVTDAINDYTSAINFGTETAEVYLGRASAYTSLNKPGKAFADLSKARDRDASLVVATPEPTGSTEESAKQPAAAEDPCDKQFGGGSQDFPHVADAWHATASNPLLLRASDEVQVGNAAPASPGNGGGGPCDQDNKHAAEPSSPAAVEPLVDRPLNTALDRCAHWSRPIHCDERRLPKAASDIGDVWQRPAGTVELAASA
jgi:tetratricopeptide (TPR) repeat protein